MSERIFVGDIEGNIEEKKEEQVVPDKKIDYTAELRSMIREKDVARKVEDEHNFTDELINRIQTGIDGGKQFSERLDISISGDRIIRPDAKIGGYIPKVTDFYSKLLEIQKIHPEFDIKINKDPENKWFEFTVTKK